MNLINLQNKKNLMGVEFSSQFEKMNNNGNSTYVIGDPMNQVHIGNNKSLVDQISTIKLCPPHDVSIYCSATRQSDDSVILLIQFIFFIGDVLFYKIHLIIGPVGVWSNVAPMKL